MPALVLGFDSSRGVYQLDVHPAADPEKVQIRILHHATRVTLGPRGLGSQVRPLANATDDCFKGDQLIT
ncbi:unnamed protein product [Cladocopium goreaui]|uniref:Uncharacterized protein n=1 Tax=Cladocopium goreaui TaxID=2562237 RepID=A0A9P1CLI6_9DINO|nr:unnamed protein product [Cladocopium goreaui]